MNYITSYCICLGLTVFHLLTKDPDSYWLAVSDLNVGVFLCLAWILEKTK